MDPCRKKKIREVFGDPITLKSIFQNRRQFLKLMGSAVLSLIEVFYSPRARAQDNTTSPASPGDEVTSTTSPSKVDYAFVSLFDPTEQEGHYFRFLRNFRKLYKYRPNTCLIPNNIKTLRVFFNILKGKPQPIGDIYIAAHGDLAGLDIRPVPKDNFFDDEIEYKHLIMLIENLTKKPKKTILIPPDLNTGPDGSPNPITVHIRGCLIGRSKAYVNKLKAAFGGAVEVTAPKVWSISYHTFAVPFAFEGLGYYFEIIRREPYGRGKGEKKLTPKELKEKAINEFMNKKPEFEFYDGGGKIPKEFWDKFIPDKLNKSGDYQKYNWIIPEITYENKRGRKITRKSLRMRVAYIPEMITEHLAIPDINKKPEKKRGKEINDIVQNHLEKISDDFPRHERVGLGSITEYVDAFKWEVKKHKGSKKVLTVSGIGYRYSLLVPISYPGTSNAIINLYWNEVKRKKNKQDIKLLDIEMAKDLGKKEPELFIRV